MLHTLKSKDIMNRESLYNENSYQIIDSQDSKMNNFDYLSDSSSGNRSPLRE